MNRNVTNKINAFIDNWIPPVFRDNKFFVAILFRIVIGKKYRFYLEFKDRIPTMTEHEINKYYTILGKTFISRKTDLNKRCIKKIAQEVIGKKILDAGAGNGVMAKKLYYADRSMECTICDIILPSKMKRVEGIEYVEATLTKLPFEENSFDTVICTHVLEHIKDYKTALQELRRVCKKKLIIVIPRQREYKYTCDLHINFYPYQYNVERLMQSHAFIELLDNDWICIEENNI